MNAIWNFEFPRCIVNSNFYKSAEMHVFTDSSRDAYAVACFGRFIYSDNSVSVIFLFEKCKVCTVGGTLSIPHLVLVAAVLSMSVVKCTLQKVT